MMSLLTFDDRVWPNRRIHTPPDGGTGRRGPLDPVGFLLEEIAAAKRNIQLQVFASDIHEDAVALAREGRYPESITADVSPGRLARFFTQEEHTYRVLPELRGVVVFTAQDVLADPPFSRLDLISCRNLLIYLRPEAQEKVLLLFHFALRDGGVLIGRSGR
jgi:two-component system, chemotaxis family, CheB/CheR fusion protein